LWKRIFCFDQLLAESGCLRGINWSLLKYVWNFDKEKRQSIEDLRKRYPYVKFMEFQQSQDVEKFLERMKKEIN